MKKTNNLFGYESPRVQTIKVDVEKGFSTSGIPSGGSNNFGGEKGVWDV